MKQEYIYLAEDVAKAKYGDHLDPIIKERLDKEIKAFSALEGIDEAIGYMREMVIKEEELFLPRAMISRMIPALTCLSEDGSERIAS